MAVCTYCSNTILFGGVRDGSNLFCNERCQQSQLLLQKVREVRDDLVDRTVAEIHQGPCPKCGGPGPVDAHRAYRVRSLLLTTTWTNTPEVCCRKCARRRQLVAMGYCLVLGWWGLPWGVLMTPLQIWRNLRAFVARTDPRRPSRELEIVVRVGLTAKQARERQRQREQARSQRPGRPQ